MRPLSNPEVRKRLDQLDLPGQLKVPSEKLDLVGDDGLVLGTVVDIEVIHPRIGPQLSERRSAGGPDRDAGRRHPIGLADADQPGAMEAASMANVVEREQRGEKPAR